MVALATRLDTRTDRLRLDSAAEILPSFVFGTPDPSSGGPGGRN
jgi:hypothetical protein